MNTIKLKNLSIGEQFVIPNLEDCFRDLAVLRSGDCSILVNGQEKDASKNVWKSGPFRLASTTNVVSLGTFLTVTEHEDGSREVEGEAKKVMGSRKIKHEIEFPEGEFKIKDLAARLKLEYHTVMNAFNRQRDNFIEVRKEANGGKRGKPVIVWKKNEK